jgi:hypothetical protein
MKRHHDMGGDSAGPVTLADHPVEPWEKLINAIRAALRARGFDNLDETRRYIEDLPPEDYDRPYFQRWAEALVTELETKGVVTRVEIEARMEKLRAELEARK